MLSTLSSLELKQVIQAVLNARARLEEFSLDSSSITDDKVIDVAITYLLRDSKDNEAMSVSK